MRPLPVFAGFVLVGLAPSFVEWRTGDEKTRRAILLYYAAAGALIWLGSR